MRSQSTKLVFLLLALAAVVQAAAIGHFEEQSALRKRAWRKQGSQDDPVKFEDLHGQYFNHEAGTRNDGTQAQFNPVTNEPVEPDEGLSKKMQMGESSGKLRLTPPSRDVMRKLYGKTIFYEGQPVFKAKAGNVLSKSTMQQAYDHFGGFHATNGFQSSVVTVGPDSKTKWPSSFEWSLNTNPGQGGFTGDRELAKFIKQKKFIEEHFGKDAAIAAYGRDVKPLQTEGPRAWIRFALPFGNRKKLMQLRYNAPLDRIRKKLGSERALMIESNARGSFLKLSADTRGRVTPEVTGDLAHAFGRIKLHFI